MIATADPTAAYFAELYGPRNERHQILPAIGARYGRVLRFPASAPILTVAGYTRRRGDWLEVAYTADDLTYELVQAGYPVTRADVEAWMREYAPLVELRETK